MISSRVHVPIDPELKNQFKAACAMNGETMAEVIAQLLQAYITQNSERKAG